jgi:hypothetical protein
MPLIDLKTNLKSLKYGKDRINEGSSGQPYVTTDPDGNTNLSLGANNIVGGVLRLVGVNRVPIVPNISAQLSRSRAGRFVNQVLGTDDFIRGGAIGSAQAAINDTFRIGAFLTSLPKGPIFIAKQVGLQLTNPKLEVKKGLAAFAGSLLKAAFSASPTQALSSVTGGLLGPTRIYNAGINTLAQVPANAFGIHFSRHGLLPIQDDETKYEKVVTFNNQSTNSKNNRLVELVDKFDLGDQQYEANPNFNLNAAKKANRQANRQNRRVNRAQNQSLKAGAQSGGFPYVPTKFKRKKLNIDDQVISSYPTGPGSTYGIGLTIIQRYSFTEDKLKIEESLGNASAFAGKSRLTTAPMVYTNALGEKAKLSVATVGKSINAYSNAIPGSTTGSNDITTALSQGTNATYADLVSKILQTTTLTQSGSYTGKYTAALVPGSTITTVTASLLRDAPNFRYYGSASISEEGSKSTYSNSSVFAREDAGIMSVVFRAINPFGQPTPNPELGINSNEQRWIFSAYMSGYKDNFDATWNDVNYAGRAESFYIYNKFKRTVNFNLKIPCFNKKQLFEKHRALGQLASVTAGSYGNNMSKEDGILLGGVLIKINLGNYLVGEYAVLNNVSYSIPDDASWDIADNALLSMYIDASFSLTIVHKDLPQYQQAEGTSGFFGYLPDNVSSTNRQGGFLTSTQIVSKFTKG